MGTLDVVTALRRAIHAGLSVPVGEEVPERLPDEFVCVRREGGRRLDALRDRPGVSVECWALSEGRAREISDAASELICSLPRTSFPAGVAAAEEETRRSDYDDERGRPRWYGSYTLTTFMA